MNFWDNQVAQLFVVAGLGLLLGRARIGGKGFGLSGVLLAGLLFGHLGANLSPVVQSIGLALFAAAIGLMAGGSFKASLKNLGSGLVFIGFFTLGVSLAVTYATARILDLDLPLAAGMMVGSLTSTPGLGAAVEALSADPMVGVGYSIAYPLGALVVVLAVGLISSQFRKNPAPPDAIEVESRQEEASSYTPPGEGRFDILSLLLIISVGVLAGAVPIPLPYLGAFTLGTAGGPLIVALLAGHYRKIGSLSMIFPYSSLVMLRDLGAVFILSQVGVSAGKHFWELATRHGFALIGGGFVITVLTVLSAYAYTVFFRLNYVNTVGAISGVMTSTPGLAASIEQAGSDAPAVAYTAVYPLAIIINILIVKILVLLPY